MLKLLSWELSGMLWFKYDMGTCSFCWCYPAHFTQANVQSSVNLFQSLPTTIQLQVHYSPNTKSWFRELHRPVPVFQSQPATHNTAALLQYASVKYFLRGRDEILIFAKATSSHCCQCNMVTKFPKTILLQITSNVLQAVEWSHNQEARSLRTSLITLIYTAWKT